ncbi:hypothetical protein TRV_07574 [Trichophyton verrucosum HKI 0517]|uniref:Beta-lactamase-related domain-containing protein n=1 Tax=Trichophyton verrucosum (strain HKI 0517) TaxID=663202 RepID=D4DK53_TRIVH|nr:uncharacterized protein TRV_07574 [Trichophyton verrucosum HKI 0517]EFE37775.1 hypothetical protein TRV_07574 [Trichophyton verrucosum HKI 0517]
MDLFRRSQFSDYIKKALCSHKIPGISISIVQDRTIASGAFGKSSLDPSTNFTPDTLVGIGPISKSLTAAAVTLLVQDNVNYPQVQYDTLMSSLLPDDFVMSGENHRDVTVEDILTHQTGMPTHEFSVFGPSAEQPDDPRSITRNLRNLPTIGANRSGFVYSNTMYTVASYLVEHVTGDSFADFLEKRIFLPLKMESTSVQPWRALAKTKGQNISVGYLWDKNAKTFKSSPFLDRPESQGAGQLITTASDHAKWITAMINREGPITEDVYNLLTKKRVLEDASKDQYSENPSFYGLGWQIQDYSGYTIVSHEGGEAGSSCDNFFVPGLKFGAFIFCNADHAHNVISLVKYRLLDQAILERQGGLACINGKLQPSFEPDWGLDFDTDDPDDLYDDDIQTEEELIQELCPDINGLRSQPQEIPLDSYTGLYWNQGYRGIKVENRGDQLFIDCTDRTTPFTLAFKHIREQVKYIVYVTEVHGNDIFPIKAEFVLDNNNRATKLGLQLEQTMNGYIWFIRRSLYIDTVY